MARSSFGRLRALVVDDNRHMCRILEAMLGGFGCGEVLSTGDGVSALRIVESKNPDLLIANINMPQLDGIALTRAIRDPAISSDPFRPVILLSAHSDPHHLMAARDAGADEFLLKPVEPERLYRAIVAAVEEQRGYVRTKTYFGPDRRLGAPRPDAADNPGCPMRVGNRVVRDFKKGRTQRQTGRSRRFTAA